MDIRCARCGTTAVPAGHEDARAFYQCEKCNRVWMLHLTAAVATRDRAPSTRVLVVDSQFPETAQMLLDGLKSRTQRKIDLLINTHHHGDHTHGNCLLPLATIIGHARILRNSPESFAI